MFQSGQHLDVDCKVDVSWMVAVVLAGISANNRVNNENGYINSTSVIVGRVKDMLAGDLVVVLVVVRPLPPTCRTNRMVNWLADGATVIQEMLLLFS